MGDEEDAGPKPNKAKIDDEFLRHPHSGAFIRNPLLDKSRSTPILFQEQEFRHNCLEEALAEYNCVTVSETSYREMMKMGATLQAAEATRSLGDQASASPPTSPLARAALSTLTRNSHTYEFVVSVSKSTYVPPRVNRRRQDTRPVTGLVIDKLNVEVSEDREGGLRIEEIKEGLVAAWNRRTHTTFQVRAGDRILKANARSLERAAPQQLAEEVEHSPDALRLVVRRQAPERRASKASVGPAALTA